MGECTGTDDDGLGVYFNFAAGILSQYAGDCAGFIGEQLCSRSAVENLAALVQQNAQQLLT